jgi:uncharacterized protein (DUF2344 family)
MAIYRASRDIEASIIDFITDELTSTWNNVAVVKTFQKVTTQNLPALCVRVGDTNFKKAEIGSNNLVRTANVFIDIFATSDGQRLDLADWIVDTVKEGCVYYDYTTTKSGRTTTVTGTTANGRINVIKINVSDINFNMDRNQLDVRDRFRTLITLTITLGRVE